MSLTTDVEELAGVLRSNQLSHEWGKWLHGYRWDHYVTLTFGRKRRLESSALPKGMAPEVEKQSRAFQFRQPSQETAARLFRQWLREVERKAQKGVSWFCATETSPAGMLHLHLLLGGTERLSATTLDRAWRNGRTHAEPYDQGRGATYYVTKYIGTSQVEYDLNLRHAKKLSDVTLP